jgi:integrase
MPRRRRLFERREVTRHGKTVWYFRRPGGPRIRLPEPYGSPEYLAAYARALVGMPVAAPLGNPDKSSLRWLVDRYKASGHYKALAKSTQVSRDHIMEAICRAAGDKPFAKISRKHIIDAMDRRPPHSANNFLVAMTVLFRWAKENGHVEANPCDTVDPNRTKIIGHHSWTPEEVEQYRAHHPVGSKARLALDLLLFTGLRRSDVVKVGKQHVRDGILSIRAGKNGELITIPIFPELAASIEATQTGSLIFLTNRKGEPFPTGQAFYVWFARQVKDAGLPAACTPHGLRKAGATIAAENGATVHELMAMFGWRRSAMAEVYTKAADRARMARAAAERIANNSRPHLGQSRKSSSEK